LSVVGVAKCALEVPVEKTSPIRILIAEDHLIVREGLVALINRRPDMTVVAEASDGRETVAQFLRHRPDVALVDLRMPEMDGAEAIAAVCERLPSARMIVLTTYDDEEDILRSFRAGAKAYMLKDAPREELLACIHAVHEGRSRMPPTIAAKLGAATLARRAAEALRHIADGRPDKGIAALLLASGGTA
jgi:two-component system, NarL family, response regulator